MIKGLTINVIKPSNASADAKLPVIVVSNFRSLKIFLLNRMVLSGYLEVIVHVNSRYSCDAKYVKVDLNEEVPESVSHNLH